MFLEPVEECLKENYQSLDFTVLPDDKGLYPNELPLPNVDPTDPIIPQICNVFSDQQIEKILAISDCISRTFSDRQHFRPIGIYLFYLFYFMSFYFFEKKNSNPISQMII